MSVGILFKLHSAVSRPGCQKGSGLSNLGWLWDKRFRAAEASAFAFEAEGSVHPNGGVLLVLPQCGVRRARGVVC
jgi:hypothetical protein